MKIYLDFDGTVVEFEFPKIGRCNFGCMEVIKKLQDAGHEIILNTARTDFKDGTLEKALDYLNTHSWHLFVDREKSQELKPITAYEKEKKNPIKWDWDYFKRYGEVYIDDAAFNMPLKDAVMTRGKMVDWRVVDAECEANGMYEPARSV